MPAVMEVTNLAERIGNLPAGVTAEAFRPLWPAVAQMWVADVRRLMAEGVSPDGRPYVPLAHGRPGQPAGAKPLRDRGILLASLTARPLPDGMVGGSNLVQAPVHQFGAVITPRRGKYLAIPLTAVAKRAGSPRRYRGVLSPRINRQTGNGVLVDEATDTAVYALVREVTIPARPFVGFSAGFLDRVGRLVADRIAQVSQTALQGLTTATGPGRA